MVTMTLYGRRRSIGRPHFPLFHAPADIDYTYGKFAMETSDAPRFRYNYFINIMLCSSSSNGANRSTSIRRFPPPSIRACWIFRGPINKQTVACSRVARHAEQRQIIGPSWAKKKNRKKARKKKSAISPGRRRRQPYQMSFSVLVSNFIRWNKKPERCVLHSTWLSLVFSFCRLPVSSNGMPMSQINWRIFQFNPTRSSCCSSRGKKQVFQWHSKRSARDDDESFSLDSAARARRDRHTTDDSWLDR